MNASILITSVNFGLFLSYLFLYYCHKEISEYEQGLSELELKKYKTIRNERMNHFIIGILVAIATSVIFNSKYSNNMNLLNKVNITVLIIFLIPMLVYKILPKSEYMLKECSQTEKDFKEWFDIYLCMKNRSIYGFLCGFSVSMIFLSLINMDFNEK